MDSQDVLNRLTADAEEYTGFEWDKISSIGAYYELNNFGDFSETPEYYLGLGIDQLCRNVRFHVCRPQAIKNMDIMLGLFDGIRDTRILDFGCGAGVLGFEIARAGNQVVFSDLDGGGSFEFLKWRLKKHEVEGCETIDALKLAADRSLSGTYEYVLLLDIIEHLSDYKKTLETACAGLQDGGFLATNFFTTVDWNNPEHVVDERVPCSDYLLELGLLPINFNVWVKNPQPLLRNICVGTLEPFQGSLERCDSELRERRNIYGD